MAEKWEIENKLQTAQSDLYDAEQLDLKYEEQLERLESYKGQLETLNEEIHNKKEWANFSVSYYDAGNMKWLGQHFESFKDTVNNYLAPAYVTYNREVNDLVYSIINEMEVIYNRKIDNANEIRNLYYDIEGYEKKLEKF